MSVYKVFINYLPGLVVLLLSMIALYSAVSFIDAHNIYDSKISALNQDNLNSAPITALRDNMAQKQDLLYWAVLAMGFSGFILSVLHARRLLELKAMHDLKQQDLNAFKSRIAALEAARDGILILNAEKEIVYFNSSLCTILDIELGEKHTLCGQSWSVLFSEDDFEVIVDDILPELEEMDFWVGEFPIYKDDGSVIYTELSITLVDDGGIVATVMDVTYRIHAEEEKKVLQEQFFQAQKMEAIGRLAGGIAHDFNNILASMNGYAEFLIEDLDKDSDQRAFAKNILQAGMQARSLVNKMLAFSRKDDEVFEEVDILASIEETLAMLNSTLSKTVDLHHESTVFSAFIKGNPTQISQLLMNLSVNAQDAMEDAHGRLSITLDTILAEETGLSGEFFTDKLLAPNETPFLKITDEGGGRSQLVIGQLLKGQDYAKVRVEDSGCGMPKAVLEHIFDPFFTTKSVGKGTGLGLATVHGVIASHQGCMVIRSTIAKGTSFDLYFPLIKCEVIETPSFEAEHYSVLERDRNKKRILLVEDQEDVRVMMLKMLNRIGYQAISAVSGRDGLEVVREDNGRYDLIITDHNMPEMTGLEMVRFVSQEYPEMPFVVLSGHAEKELEDQISKHPAIKASLKKPVSKEVLSQNIDYILGLVA